MQRVSCKKLECSVYSTQTFSTNGKEKEMSETAVHVDLQIHKQEVDNFTVMISFSYNEKARPALKVTKKNRNLRV